MREIKEIEEVIIKELVEKVICNGCGKEDDGEYVNYSSSIESFSHSFGFGSNKDTETHEFELCDECYDNFIAGFKIKPNIR